MTVKRGTEAAADNSSSVLIPEEAEAVTELFQRYASGTTTLSALAGWMNEQGFRTRNMHKLENSDGSFSYGPRLFTTASIRGILHNSFYTGQVNHKGQIYAGLHQPLVSQEIFDAVQIALRKNNGRSKTLASRPDRHYLLKGLIKCVHCGMPMWAQTFVNGNSFYREEQNSRSHGVCAVEANSIPCPAIDEQMIQLVSHIELGDRWMEEVLAIISVKDEADKIAKKRQQLQQRRNRMGKIFLDGLMDEVEYHRQKRLLDQELESLIIPEVRAAEEAGKLLQELPRLWEQANIEEQWKLLTSMLDAVYIDRRHRLIVSVKPKPPFIPIFRVAALRQGAGISIPDDDAVTPLFQVNLVP